MKNPREFEFTVSPSEGILVTVTSLADWVASIETQTNATYPSPAKNVDPVAMESKRIFFEEVASRVRMVFPHLQSALQGFQQGATTGVEFESIVQDLIANQRILIPKTKLASVFTRVRRLNPTTAIVAQGHLAGIDFTDLLVRGHDEALISGEVFQGLALGEHLKRGPLGKPDGSQSLSVTNAVKSEIEAIVEAKLSGQKALVNFAVDNATQKLEEASQGQAERSATYEDLRVRLEEFLKAAPIELNNLKEAFRFEGSTRAAFAHWDSKSAEHRSRSKNYFGAFIATLAASIVGISVLVTNFVPSGSKWLEIPFALSAVLALCFAITFWLGRLIVKQYLSERHLAEDAAERSALIKTFTSMIRGGEIKSEHIDAVLATLFRSASTGLLAGDGSPTLPADIVTKLVDRIRT